MNLDTKENLWLLDHLSKCRCCFEKFNKNKNQVEITDILKNQFLELTNIELLLSPNYSNKICIKCTNELQSISNFRLNLITKQQQLYEFVITSQYQIQDAIKFESVDVKNESQSTYEFDFGTHYEEIDIPEALVISEAPKIKKQLSRTKRDSQSSKKRCSEKLRHENIPELNEKTKLLTNVQKKHVESQQYCTECKKVFHNSAKLAKHIDRVHSKGTQLFCDLCGYDTILKKELEKHIKTHLRKLLRKKKVKQIASKPMCPQCGLFIKCHSNLMKHVRRVHLKEKYFFCDLCDYGAFFKNSLENHLKTHLKYREKLYCDQCEYVSISSDMMKKHLNKGDHRSLSKKKVKSECHCGKVFQSTKALYIHKRNAHDKQFNHVCTMCTKAFPFFYQLKKHLESHGVDRKREFGCEVCGKMFVTLGDLKIHSIYHKEPKFVCSFEGCTKKFFRSNLLKSHKKTHTDQRDFACQLCDNKYYEDSHLQRHVLHFHKQVKINCELPGCKSKFARKEKYRKHVLTHHKDFPQDKIKLLFIKIKQMKQE